MQEVDWEQGRDPGREDPEVLDPEVQDSDREDHALDSDYHRHPDNPEHLA